LSKGNAIVGHLRQVFSPSAIVNEGGSVAEVTTLSQASDKSRREGSLSRS
jgi:hypothetical protein